MLIFDPTKLTARLRNGMWVKYEGRIGIWITRQEVRTRVYINEDGNPVAVSEDVVLPFTVPCRQVHIVDEVGDTTLVLHGVAPEAVTQATLGDIPEARRPNQAMGEKLGYA